MFHQMVFLLNERSTEPSLSSRTPSPEVAAMPEAPLPERLEAYREWKRGQRRLTRSRPTYKNIDATCQTLVASGRARMAARYPNHLMPRSTPSAPLAAAHDCQRPRLPAAFGPLDKKDRAEAPARNPRTPAS